MSVLTFRPATAVDQTAIRRMVYRAGINPLGLDWRRFLVAEEAGQIVAIGQIKPHNDGSRELASIAVIPSRQGQGVGSALVSVLLAGASAPLYLTCRAGLQAYYARFGFRTIGPEEMPPYFRRVARLMNLFAPAGRPRLLVMRWDGPAPDQGQAPSQARA